VVDFSLLHPEDLVWMDDPTPTTIPVTDTPAQVQTIIVTTLPPPPTATPEPQQIASDTAADSQPIAPVADVVAVGDSVMLGAVHELAQAFGYLEIDAEIGRQASTTISLLAARRAAGRLGAVVILHVGNNGVFRASQIDQVMQQLTGVPRVVFVNVRVPRQWEGPNNAALAERVSQYANAVLVDWYSASIGRPDLFYQDGIHLRPEGARAYAALIVAAALAP
jgi:hypothetical protein